MKYRKLWAAKIDEPSAWNFESEPASLNPKLLAMMTNHGFKFASADSDFAMALPFWVFVIFSFLMGSVSWIRHYSLRTLLIATTLVAVALGAIIWMAK